MIFSDIFKYTSTYPVFSPNGLLFASATNYKLLIKEIKSMQTFKVFTCIDSISEMKWSKDSMFILCVLKKRNIIQVWSLEYPEWQCKINEGSAGLLKCDWCPDSRHILTTLDFFIRITLWSVEDQNVSYMKYPKNCSKYYDFSNNGNYFALAERRNFKDYVSIFKTMNKWSLFKNFQVATSDLDGVKWLPYLNLICWDSCLKYTLLLYNINGELLKSVSNDSSEYHLGIKLLRSHPVCHLMVIGIYNSCCQVLNSSNLATIATIDCSLENLKKAKIPTKTSNRLIYYENENGDYSISQHLDIVPGNWSLGCSREKKCIMDIQFSFDGLCFYTRFENEPNVLFIWNVKRISLSVILVHNNSIKSASWSPTSVNLALVTGNDRLYMWTPKACISVKVPDSELAILSNVSWNTDGTNVCLSSKLSSCIVFLNDENCDKNKSI